MEWNPEEGQAWVKVAGLLREGWLFLWDGIFTVEKGSSHGSLRTV